MNKKSLSKITLAMAIILIYLAVQFLPVILTVFVPVADRVALSMNLTLLFSFLGTAIMLLLNHLRTWTPANSISNRPSASIGKVLAYGIVGFIGALIVQIIALNVEVLLFQTPVTSENTEVLLDLTNQYPFFIFNIIVFAPVMEEFVFRKAIVTSLVDKIGIVGAATISSLIFAFAHADGHLLIYGALGLWFSFLYNKTKNIATPMIAHGLMNAMSAYPILLQLLSH